MKNFSFKFKILIGVIVIAGGFVVWRIFFDKGVVSVFFTPSEFEQQFDIVLKDYNGNDVNLLNFKNNPLILYSWASWCPFCKDELVVLSELQRENNQLVVVAINRAESRTIAKNYSDKLDIDNLILLLDPTDSFYRTIGGFSMPEAIFIDKKGNIVEHKRSPVGEIPLFY